MNRVEITSWTKVADLARIVRATFPDYKRRVITVQASETVTFHDLNWSGGTRSEYRACTLDGQPLGGSAKYNAQAPWDNQAEGKTIPLPQGSVMVQGGHFCGKVSRLTIYVNPADMPKYLEKV